MIITLGRYSLARYFSGQSISKIHGKPRKEGNVIYYPMYHPAAALHQGSLRRIIEEDMLRIPHLLNRTAELPGDEGEAKQLNLF